MAGGADARGGLAAIGMPKPSASCATVGHAESGRAAGGREYTARAGLARPAAYQRDAPPLERMLRLAAPAEAAGRCELRTLDPRSSVAVGS